MASYLLASFEFNHVQALHDLVMMQMAECLSIDLEFRDFSPCRNNSIVSLIFRNWHVTMHDVSDGVELFIAIIFNLNKLLLS